MTNLIAIGPAENQTFYRKYLAPTDLYDHLMLRNLDHEPFRGSWDGTSAPTMAFILYHARAHIKMNRVNRKLILPVVMAEFLGPFMHQDRFATQADGRAEVIRLVKFIIGSDELIQVLAQNVSKAGYDGAVASAVTNQGPFTQAAANLYGVFTNDDWPADPNTDINLDSAIRILFYIATMAQVGVLTHGLSLIVYITVSICKRGTVSDQFCRKIEDGIKADLNHTITLDVDVISTFYTSFATGINDANIQTVKDRWEDLIPDEALRLKLTIRQLVGSGLTAFITIGRALRKYADFDWVETALLFSNDFINYNTAVIAVAGNQYYGFKKELGCVRSTLYPNLAYVAKELLIQVGGESSLRNYRGWRARVPEQGVVDGLIGDYIRRRGEKPERVEGAREPAVLVTVRESVNTADNADIFQG